MKILVINAGSSSLKYQLIDMETEKVMAKGLCERSSTPHWSATKRFLKRISPCQPMPRLSPHLSTSS